MGDICKAASMASERTIQEFEKLFPDADKNETLIKEFKCCLNERTSRGLLYLTNKTLYFFTKMLGEKKYQIPLTQVTSVQLSEISIDQAIEVVSSEHYKFLYFQQDIEDAFNLIESTWKDLSKKPEVKRDTKPEETQESSPPQDKDTAVSDAVTEEYASQETIPAKAETTKKPASNIKEVMRQRQAKAQKLREESQAKIKAKVSETRMIVEQ